MRRIYIVWIAGADKTTTNESMIRYMVREVAFIQFQFMSCQSNQLNMASKYLLYACVLTLKLCLDLKFTVDLTVLLGTSPLLWQQ